MVVPYELSDPSYNGGLAMACGLFMTAEDGYEKILTDHIYSWEGIRSGLLFGNIGRQSASYYGSASIATDGGEEPPIEEDGSPVQYKRPPEIIVRGNRSPEQRELSPEMKFD